MEAKDVKVGMKVVPTAISAMHFESLDAWKNNNCLGGKNDCCVKFLDDNGYLVVGKDTHDGEYSVGCPKDAATSWSFRASDLTEATIGVGDTVRVRGDNGAYGDECTVTAAYPSAGFFHINGGHQWWHISDVDLVRKAKPAEPEKPADRRPTVGDWVEVVEDAMFFRVGFVGLVVGVKDACFRMIGTDGEVHSIFRSRVKLTTPPEQKPETVLKSDADAAVRRAYCEGFSDGQKHIVGCVVDPKPTQKTLSYFWNDKSFWSDK